MTGVTQKIPNYVGGISQQPDELMPIGSVKDALNVFPDVSDGLRKRTGSRLINPLLTTQEGSWFHFDYAPNEKYVGKVNFDGSVDMFSLTDGLPSIIGYKAYDPTDDIGEIDTGYEDCDFDKVQGSKRTWQDKKKELETAEGQLNILLNQRESFGNEEERRVYYQVDPNGGNPDGAPPDDDGDNFFDDSYNTEPRVYQGYVRKPGADRAWPPAPEGWEGKRGNQRDVSNIGCYYQTNTGWDYTSDTVTLYEYVHVRRKGVPAELAQQIADQEALVNTLQEQADGLYDVYQAELAKCGYQQQGTSTRALFNTEVAPDYLKHSVNGQIRTLTVGDTIFLSNPEVPVQMVESSFTTRPTENYIELQTIAGAKVYTLELVTQQSTSQPFTVVTKVSVNNAEFIDDDGACLLNGFKRETFNDGDKKNLDVSLTVTGSPVQEIDDDLVSYNCKYFVDARINNGGSNWQVGDRFTFEDVKGKNYQCRVEEVETQFTPNGKYLFPDQTPSDGEVVKADAILADLKKVIEAEDDLFQVQIIGNGLYVTHFDPTYVFNFATPEGQLMKITTNEVNNISELPAQCKGGYIVKINNTDSDFDDYYAVFETEYAGIDGPGAWVETVKPGINTVISPASMPHSIKYEQAGFFTVSPITWEKRLVGDETTNPRPSFVSRQGKKDYRGIKAMAFFRNRLCMLSGDNVVCSRPGDYYNFFNGSALTQVDNDPLDIAVGATSSSANASLEDAIEVSDGLLVFSANEQHILSTDSEVFGPRTARFNRVGTYRYSGPESRTIYRSDGTKYKAYRGASVFSLGNSVAFMHDSGLNTRMLEMYDIGRTQEASVNELTKPVSRLIPFGINAVADSKDNNIIALSNIDSNDVYVYRYFDNDRERVQSAWFRWKMLGKMIYHCIMDDVYWYISIGQSSSQVNNQADIVSLQRIDLKDELATAFVRDKFVPSTDVGVVDQRQDNDRPYQAHLDNYRIAQPSEFTYYSHINQTYFRAPLVYYKDEVDAGNLVAYMLSPTQLQRESDLYGEDKDYYFVSIGSMIPIRVEEDNMGTWFVMDGDWSNTRMMIGYQYEMMIEFPTLYATSRSNQGQRSVVKSDTRASLTLHRIKLNFGQTGVYETTLKRRGRDEYTELYECKTMDGYPANEVAFDQERVQTVPVYAKNTDTQIFLTSTHPSPATLVSMEWEGSFTNRYYKSV